MTTPAGPRGAGPTVRVHSSVDPETGRPIAVKVYPRVPDRRTEVAFDRERAALGRLRQAASVVRPESTVEWPDGSWGVITEICPQSLAELVATAGPRTVFDVAGIGEVIASVLAEAHEAGLVHGGLTPTNVLFRASGQPVLSDFGLSLRHAFPRGPEHGVGYAAPELLRGDEPDVGSDLYGLAAVMYFALTGKPPFPAVVGEAPSDRVLRVLSEPPPALTGVPAEFARLITALLAKDPAERPAATEVVAALRTVLVADAVRRTAPARPLRPAPADPTPPAPAPSSPPPSSPAPSSPAPGSPSAGTAAADQPTWVPSTAADPASSSAPAAPVPGGATRGGPTGAASSGGGLPGAAFDDFREELPPGIDDPVARARPLVVFGPDRAREKGGGLRSMGTRLAGAARSAKSWLAVGAAVIALLAVVPVLFGGDGSTSGTPTPAPTGGVPTAAPSTPAASTPAPSKPAAQVSLAPPVDRKTSVQLRWTAPPGLTFAVIIAKQGEKSRPQLVGQRTTANVQVEPAVRYCFLIQGQGTASKQVYESQSRPIRGAVCKN